jgi:hypothetical protein
MSPPQLAGNIAAILLRLYEHDADAGIHAAVRWLLGNTQQGASPRLFDWHQAGALATIDRKLAHSSAKDRQRYINKEGQNHGCASRTV